MAPANKQELLIISTFSATEQLISEVVIRSEFDRRKSKAMKESRSYVD